MPERTEHAPGTPSWVDLATPDPSAARSFYARLFGWEYTEEPTDQGTPYVMATRHGKAAAGMMQLSPEMAAQGMPPMWSTYVTVADVEAATATVGRAGGTVVAPVMDVMEAGRMAVVADPAGAVLCLWQPGQHIGAELVHEHGTLTWNELLTPEVGKASAFYEQLLGWKAETADMGGTEYTAFMLDGRGVAGAMKPPMEGIPSHWFVYFAVDDCDDAVATARAHGGTIQAEPMDIPPGRMAVITDPQGATFGVIQLSEPGT